MITIPVWLFVALVLVAVVALVLWVVALQQAEQRVDRILDEELSPFALPARRIATRRTVARPPIVPTPPTPPVDDAERGRP